MGPDCARFQKGKIILCMYSAFINRKQPMLWKYHSILNDTCSEAKKERERMLCLAGSPHGHQLDQLEVTGEPMLR